MGGADAFERELWEVPLTEKRASLARLKSDGDAAFVRSDLPRATAHYTRALAYIEDIRAADGEYTEAIVATRVTLLLNLAACTLKAGDFAATISHCTSGPC